MKFKNNLKAITPIVAITLLLVVAVSATIGFKGWYGSFSSDLLTDIEKDNSEFRDIKVETMVDSEIYLNSGEDNKLLNISEIKINNKNCQIESQEVVGQLNKIKLFGCDEQISRGGNEVIILLDDNLISDKLLVKQDFPESFSVPNGVRLIMNNCPIGWNELGLVKQGFNNINCFDVNCRVCETTVDSNIPKNSKIAMVSCPKEWKDIGEVKQGFNQISCPDGSGNNCRTCETTKNTNFLTGSQVVMTSCPSGWTDLGFMKQGFNSITCGVDDCKICEKN